MPRKRVEDTGDTATKKKPVSSKVSSNSDTSAKKVVTKKVTKKTIVAKKSPQKSGNEKANPPKKFLDPLMDLPPGQVIVYGESAIQPYQAAFDESYMNSKQRAHFVEILTAWKQALMQEVDRTVGLLKGEAKNLADMTDRASQEEEFSIALRARDRERKLIKRIEVTLSRIREDDYGFCDSCGVEIGIRRLEARPTADLCVDCKTLDEMVEKQTKG